MTCQAHKVMTASEVARVIRGFRTHFSEQKDLYYGLPALMLRSRTVFRMAASLGMRCCEMSKVQMGDFIFDGQRPMVRIRKEISKSGRPRMIPMWWDSGSLKDLREWYEFRMLDCTGPKDWFLVNIQGHSTRRHVAPAAVGDIWARAIGKFLPPGRVKQLTPHCGRHTFCTHALERGRSLTEVQAAAGHKSVATTTIYLHVIERHGVPDLYPEHSDSVSMRVYREVERIMQGDPEDAAHELMGLFKRTPESVALLPDAVIPERIYGRK